MTIHYLQIITAFAWLVVAVVWTPGLIRVWRGTADRLDAARMPMLMVAATQTGFSLRWIIWPDAMDAMPNAAMMAWGALYVLSCMTAAYLLATFKSVGRVR